jgi:hypothetical protein
LLGWIEFESFRLFCPELADVLVWREALQGLQSTGEIVGADEIGEMGFELFVTVIMGAFDGGFFECPVHAFDLTIGPGMLDFSEPMFDAVFPAAHVKHMCHVFCRRAACGARGERELDALSVRTVWIL